MWLNRGDIHVHKILMKIVYFRISDMTMQHPLCIFQYEISIKKVDDLLFNDK